MKSEPKGVAGWLAFRILCYEYVVPLQAIYYIFKFKSLTAASVEIPVACFAIAIGIQLDRLRTSGVIMARLFETGSLVSGLLTMLVYPAVGATAAASGLIWLIYFVKSARVRNTYFMRPPSIQSELL